MKFKLFLAMLISSLLLVNIVSAELVFFDSFESDKLDEGKWGIAGAGVGGPNEGKIMDKQAHSGKKSWWIGSLNGIYHVLSQPLKTATIFCYFYDNDQEANINAQVIGCTTETTKVTGFPIGAGSWMYMGLCTTGPKCAGYYFRSVDKGELCVGDKRATGWHLFAYIIDAGTLTAYVDGKKMEDCKMEQLGTFAIFHAWSADQFLKDGGFVDDVYIYSEVRDAAEGPISSVRPSEKLATTWGEIKY